MFFLFITYSNGKSSAHPTPTVSSKQFQNEALSNQGFRKSFTVKRVCSVSLVFCALLRDLCECFYGNNNFLQSWLRGRQLSPEYIFYHCHLHLISLLVKIKLVTDVS